MVEIVPSFFMFLRFRGQLATEAECVKERKVVHRRAKNERFRVTEVWNEEVDEVFQGSEVKSMQEQS